MYKYLKTRLKAFRDDVEGSVSIEAVMIFPVMFWAFAAMMVFFDAYRQTSVNNKAAYTISDMISRETNPVTPEYLENTKKFFDYMTVSDGSDTRIRVSLLRWKEDRQIFQSVWSKTVGGGPELANSDVANWTDRLPMMANQEQIILVETWTDYDPPLDVGLADREISTFVFTRPRFSPQIVWSDT